ncbi:hypothetical protein PYCC9005_003352 [Savitreella phatthalungensis]
MASDSEDDFYSEAAARRKGKTPLSVRRKSPTKTRPVFVPQTPSAAAKLSRKGEAWRQTIFGGSDDESELPELPLRSVRRAGIHKTPASSRRVSTAAVVDTTPPPFLKQLFPPAVSQFDISLASYTIESSPESGKPVAVAQIDEPLDELVDAPPPDDQEDVDRSQSDSGMEESMVTSQVLNSTVTEPLNASDGTDSDDEEFHSCLSIPPGELIEIADEIVDDSESNTDTTQIQKLYPEILEQPIFEAIDDEEVAILDDEDIPRRTRRRTTRIVLADSEDEDDEDDDECSQSSDDSSYAESGEDLSNGSDSDEMDGFIVYTPPRKVKPRIGAPPTTPRGIPKTLVRDHTTPRVYVDEACREKDKKEQEKARKAALKAFAGVRETLAISTLNEYLHGLAEDIEESPKVTKSDTAALENVTIVWTPLLLTTAGRATYSRSADVRAKIELSLKVLTDRGRLRNTLAHELCHLLAWCVDADTAGAPHGGTFKRWASILEKRFGDVQVGTTHAYTVEAKYMWRCSGCARTYARHSKSIDPTRVVCGANACGGKLLQERPPPRQTPGPRAAGDGSTARRPLGDALLTPNKPATPSGLDKFAAYRNKHIPELRAQHPTKTYRELIKLVSVQYAADKASTAVLGGENVGKEEEDEMLVAQVATLHV